MWMFWVCASGLAAAAAALMAGAAARVAAAGQDRAEDAVSSVYRRQLGEVRELADRGLIAGDELRAAEAEAGRRLLADADARHARWGGGDDRARSLVVATGVVSAAGALCLYMLVGAQGASDQPFAARLSAWRRTDPARLSAEQMSAVLSAIARERPRDPTVYEYLGRSQLAAGDAATASASFAKAVALQPRSATLQAELGEALTLGADAKVTPDAVAAFQRAITLDPTNTAARYFLGRSRSAAGDQAGARAYWRSLAADLPPDDPRGPALRAEMARAEGGPPTSASSSSRPPPLDADTRSLALGMVARLAARLATAPDDPPGWARLVRAYGVLGEKAAQRDALSRARRRFAGRPTDLAAIEAEAKPLGR